MENWFDNGSIAGYRQIQARLDYLEQERLPRDERNYEVWVVKRLLSQIPNHETREIYWRKLGEIRLCCMNPNK